MKIREKEKESIYEDIKAVATKFCLPSFPHRLLPRPQLMKVLDQGLGRRLTLVSAPAGFGKTTLLAKWLDQKLKATTTEPDRGATSSNPLPLVAAWVSLDESDNNPQSFWKYVFTVLEQSLEGLSKPLISGQLKRGFSSISSSSCPPVEDVLALFINRIVENDRQLAVILDDYQHITDPAIHSSVSYLLDHLPPQLHIFIVTRNIPALPLSRLRARGQLLELDVNVLRCNLAETADFLKDVLDLADLGASLVLKIFNRTEGWLAGLHLLGLSLQRYSVSSGRVVITELDNPQPYIIDYLSQEVLQGQPNNIQTFLSYTSMLPQFCSDLCNELLDRSDSDQILDYLKSNNLFIFSVDGQPGWYRYHTLFAEVLRFQLEQIGLETVSDLKKHATLWYAKREVVDYQTQIGVKTTRILPSGYGEHSNQTNNTTKTTTLPLPKTSLSRSALPGGPGVIRSLSALEQKTPAGSHSEVFGGPVYPISQPVPPLSCDSLPMFVEPLSKRELEVLYLLTTGAANHEIAQQLTVTLNTVKKHTSNILSKLGAPNRTQAVYRARKLGLTAE